MHYIEISTPLMDSSKTIRAKYCSSFLCKFKGLMLKSEISTNEGLLLVENNNSIINTSIHMLFMLFDITAVWINSDNVIVDVKLAKKWYPFYFPKNPAKYILECHPSQLESFQIGDVVSIKNV